MIGKKIHNLWRCSFLCGLLLALGGCSALTGKDQIRSLESDRAALEGNLSETREELKLVKERLDQSTAEGQKLQEQNAQLKQQLVDTKAGMEACRAKLEVESKRSTGIKVIFFNGDIIYEVSSEAYVDYRAGIRYLALANPAFNQQLTLFEQGKGGDSEVLTVMKSVDVNKDRYVDSGECRSFRVSQEAAFNRNDSTSTVVPAAMITAPVSAPLTAPGFVY